MISQLLKYVPLFLIMTAGFLRAEEGENAYILRPDDTVRISVYEEPDLSVQVRILKTGQASFPLIGSVEIGGLKVSSAAERIRALYAKDYLVDPKLTLTVDQYATDFISVLGEVKQSGQISIPQTGDLDLGSALASAGGVSESADVNAIQLVRSSGGTTTFSLAAIQGAAGRTKLGAGDRVIVNKSRFVKKFVTVLGPVGKPGAIPFPVDGRLDLVTAIAMAGGLTELANSKKVSINRGGRVNVVNFREISEHGDHPYFLQPDDVVTIAERIF